MVLYCDITGTALALCWHCIVLVFQWYCTDATPVPYWEYTGPALRVRVGLHWICNGSVLVLHVDFAPTAPLAHCSCTGAPLMLDWYSDGSTLVALDWYCAGTTVVLHCTSLTTAQENLGHTKGHSSLRFLNASIFLCNVMSSIQQNWVVARLLFDPMPSPTSCNRFGKAAAHGVPAVAPASSPLRKVQRDFLAPAHEAQRRPARTPTNKVRRKSHAHT